MKKNNIWHITWIVSMYAVLITILFLVITYKVKWEDRDLSKYLYFYNCGRELCTTENTVKEYIASIRCDKDICPTIKDIKNSLVILNNNDKDILFDYKKNQNIDDSYKEYSFTTKDDYFIVKNDASLYGVINTSGDIAAEFQTKEIVDYIDNTVAYKKDNKYGIYTIGENATEIDATYDYIQLINNRIFIAKNDNIYKLMSINNNPVNNTEYDYLYAYNNVIIAIKNSQLDITDYNLKSKLLMKINTYYRYNREGDRTSLEISPEGNTIRFKIYDEDDSYTNYIYDIKNNKLFN